VNFGETPTFGLEHSQVLLCAAIPFYKVPVNTELVTTEAMSLSDTQGWVPTSLWSRFCKPGNVQPCFFVVLFEDLFLNIYR